MAEEKKNEIFDEVEEKGKELERKQTEVFVKIKTIVKGPVNQLDKNIKILQESIKLIETLENLEKLSS